MSGEFQGYFHDGRRLAGAPAVLTVTADHLLIAVPEKNLAYPLGEIRVSDRLGRLSRWIYLPDGGSVVTENHAALDALRPGRLTRALAWLETQALAASLATVAVVLGVAALLHFGLPALARSAALAVPVSVEQHIGSVSLRAIDHMLRPSRLDYARQVELRSKLAEFEAQLEGPPSGLRLEFRSMGKLAPNAFALPGGIIVLSDELVALTADDAEILAVLAHEVGHLRHRHSLQGLLRGSAALLLISTVTGDLSTLTNFAATIPTQLLQRGYSREFELEADDYARHALSRAGIPLKHYAHALNRLEASRKDGPRDLSYLSTHPATAERIRRLDPSGRLLAETPPPPRPTVAAVLPQRGATIGAVTRIADRPPPPKALPLEPVRFADPPLLRTPVDPVYPLSLRALGIRGQVTVEFIVTTDGDVANPRVINSSHKGFEAAALGAVQQWKFSPARQAGRPVAMKVQQVITFNLNDDRPAKAPVAPRPRPVRRSLRPPAWPELAGWPTASFRPYTVPPEVLVWRKPVYPAGLASGETGFAEVDLLIGVDGIPRNVWVTRSSRPEFAEPALAAAKKYLFAPALLYDRPVESRLRIGLTIQRDQAPARRPR